MDIKQLENYAPYLVILMMFLWQNKVFVRPEELEKKHREILEDVKNDYVELNAYKEFQNHVLTEIKSIKNDIAEDINELKEILKRRRKDD